MAAPHALMQLSLSAEDRAAAAPRSQRALQRRMDALVDGLPSPVASASSRDFASGRRRGLARLAPLLSRSSSSEAPAVASAAGAAAANVAGAPPLQRAKTDSGMGAPSLEPRGSSIPVTAMFASLRRPAARRSTGGADAGDSDGKDQEKEREKLCPLDSPVAAAAPVGRSFGSGAEEDAKTEAKKETKATGETKAETKARRFVPGIPSLVRKSSRDAAGPQQPQQQQQELDQQQESNQQEQTAEQQPASESPTVPARGATPKKTLRKFFVPSLRRSSTGSSEKSLSSSVAPVRADAGDESNSATPAIAEHPEAEATDAGDAASNNEPEAAPAKTRMFGIPSLLRTLTDSKRDRLDSASSVGNQRESVDAAPSPTHSSSSSASNQTQPPSPVGGPNPKHRRSMLPPVPPGTKAAARFFSGMKPKLLRNISTAKSAEKPALCSPTKEKTPSTAEEDSSDTNAADEDEEMNSLLFMLQVPRGRRGSQLPLMA